ncbi:kelch repeat-containing protein [Sorangium sp. So ce590]|uniref:Kelch repeat-containing protein n=1 Tax=Sorangium sp. So ce590 TaxID=3133317 RepID=UPI003F639832
MSPTGHCHRGLIAFLSLAALVAAGCGPASEPAALAEAALEDAALQANAAPSADHHAKKQKEKQKKKCRGHIGVHAEWSSVAPLPRARERHIALLMPDGQVMVAGGSGDYPYPTTVDFYNPAADAWTTGGTLPYPLAPVGAAPLPDGRVLFSPGGLVYDPSTGATTSVPLTPGESIHGWEFAQTALTPLPNGLVLRTGGSDDESVLKEAVLYDPATNTWSSAGSMSVTRHLHTATLLQDGRVLVAGGYKLNGNEMPEGRTGVEIYDPATGAWTAAAPTNLPRMQHTATLLPSGRVLVVGGGGQIYGGTEEEIVVLVDAGETAEIYDPASDTWTLTPPPNFRHTWASAVAPMSHGRVMAIGDEGAEIYKEANNTWTVIDDPIPRAFHTATTLQDGSVLITGGYDATYFSNPPAIESVERYGGCKKKR